MKMGMGVKRKNKREKCTTKVQNGQETVKNKAWHCTTTQMKFDARLIISYVITFIV